MGWFHDAHAGIAHVNDPWRDPVLVTCEQVIDSGYPDEGDPGILAPPGYATWTEISWGAWSKKRSGAVTTTTDFYDTDVHAWTPPPAALVHTSQGPATAEEGTT
jgi:hypothetical protein